MRFGPPPPALRLLAACLTAFALAGCGAIKKSAINNVASTLSSSGDVFTRDDDPELVRQAHSVRAEAVRVAARLGAEEQGPAHRDVQRLHAVRLRASSRPTRDVLGEAHHDEAKALRERALKLYLRAKGYCLRAMEVRFPGITPKLLADPEPALKKAEKKDVPLLYWTAASWGAAISLGLDKPDLVVDHPTVRALAERALALDERGATARSTRLLISLDSLPEALGGSVAARARALHESRRDPERPVARPVRRAGRRASSVPAQDRPSSRSCCNEALAIDPEKDPCMRLVTLITQRRARALLDQIDTLFAK